MRGVDSCSPTSRPIPRDRAALDLVAALTLEAGLIHALRGLPPATADRVAEAAGWSVAPTRAALQALGALGSVRHDDELGTWRLDADPAAPIPDPGRLPALAAALTGADGASLDRPPIATLEQHVLPGAPELEATLGRGARVVGLPGTEGVLTRLEERWPRTRALRASAAEGLRGADLVLALSPLAAPPDPGAWCAALVSAIAPAGFALVRALEHALTPPEPAQRTGRGWWHALNLVAAQRGGAGRPPSAEVLWRALTAAGARPRMQVRAPGDPACVHLLVAHPGTSGPTRPR